MPDINCVEFGSLQPFLSDDRKQLVTRYPLTNFKIHLLHDPREIIQFLTSSTNITVPVALPKRLIRSFRSSLTERAFVADSLYERHPVSAALDILPEGSSSFSDGISLHFPSR